MLTHLRLALGALSAVLLVACQSSSPAPSDSVSTADDSATQQVQAAAVKPDAPKPPTASKSGYIAREWGLVRFTAEGGELATSGHEMRVRPPRPIKMAPRKPLIYLHPEPDFDPETKISVTVKLAAGNLREVWPTPAAGPQPAHTGTHAFGQIEVRVGESCGKDAAPALNSQACRSLTDGGVCEAAEMGAYIRDVKDCLSVSGVKTPALVYNAEIDGAKPPVELVDAEARNTSAHAVGPVYLRLADGGYARVDKLAAGASVKLADAARLPDDSTEREATLREDLLATGMTEDLANDFIDAWRPDVLAGAWKFNAMGWYSASGADSVATLEFDPAPVKVSRALLWSIEY